MVPFVGDALLHAGAGNVDGVLTNVVKPTLGDKSIITTIWRSEYGGFKNSSQTIRSLPWQP